MASPAIFLGLILFWVANEGGVTVQTYNTNSYACNIFATVSQYCYVMLHYVLAASTYSLWARSLLQSDRSQRYSMPMQVVKSRNMYIQPGKWDRDVKAGISRLKQEGCHLCICWHTWTK